MRLASLPWRNVARHPGRSALTGAAVAAAVLAFLVIRAAVHSFELGGRQAQPDRLGVRNSLSFTMPLPARYVDEIRRVPGVRAATFASFFNGQDPREPAHAFTSIAVDAASFLAVADEIALAPDAAARWTADRGAIIVGAPLAKRLGVGAGDVLTLRGTIYPGEWRFTVAGVFTVARPSPAARHLYLHWERVDDALPEWRRGQIGWIAVRVDDPGRAGAVAAAVDARFADRDLRTVTISERAVYDTYLGLLSSVLGVLDLVTALLAAVVLVVVGGAVATSVRERTSELAVLRALGFAPATLAALVLAEGGALGALGGALGALLAQPVIRFGVGRWIEDNLSALFPAFAGDGAATAMAVAGATLAGGLAAVLPAVAAARLPTAAALRLAGE